MDKTGPVTRANPEKKFFVQKFLTFTWKNFFFTLEEKVSYTFPKSFLCLHVKKQIL